MSLCHLGIAAAENTNILYAKKTETGTSLLGHELAYGFRLSAEARYAHIRNKLLSFLSRLPFSIEI